MEHGVSMSKTKIVVTQDADAPVATEILAKSIVEIDKHFKAVLNAGLKRETLVSLIHDSSGIAKGTIRVVLNNLETLKEQWCSK
jgi:hypothetical protein